MVHRLLPAGNRVLVRTIAGLNALDTPGRRLGKLARATFKPRPVKDAISGSWLGHPLHPVLTDVTIGTFTSAVMLDWLGGRRSAPAAQRLIGLGLLSAAPAASAGYSDWADTEVGDEAVRRIGLVHASSNLVASSLFAASWAARRRGGDGRALALAGAAALTMGGYLGGHLSFAEGVGVDQTTFEEGPEGWVDAIGDEAVAEGALRCVEVEGTPVVIARVDGALCALSDRCAHRGGPLHEGELRGTEVICPWHESVFDVRDGSLIHGPAAYPQPAWDTRVRAGRVEVRRR